MHFSPLWLVRRMKKRRRAEIFISGALSLWQQVMSSELKLGLGQTRLRLGYDSMISIWAWCSRSSDDAWHYSVLCQVWALFDIEQTLFDCAAQSAN